MRPFAAVQGLDEIDDAAKAVRHPVPEHLIAGGPKNPAVAPLPLGIRQFDPTIHLLEQAGRGFGKIRGREPRRLGVVGNFRPGVAPGEDQASGERGRNQKRGDDTVSRPLKHRLYSSSAPRTRFPMTVG